MSGFKPSTAVGSSDISVPPGNTKSCISAVDRHHIMTTKFGWVVRVCGSCRVQREQNGVDDEASMGESLASDYVLAIVHDESSSRAPNRF